MSATAVRAYDILGQRGLRIFLVALAAVLVIMAFALPSLPYAKESVAYFVKKQGLIYSAAFTFYTVFWTANLTIWTLLKSRATRYIERLADGAVFRDFMRGFEVRIAVAFCVMILTFAIFIMDLSPAIPVDWSTVIVLVWVLAFVGSNALLIESLFSARVVLD